MSDRLALRIVLAASVALSACAADAEPASSAADLAEATPDATAHAPGAAAGDEVAPVVGGDGADAPLVPGQLVIRNPVKTNCADPSVLKDGTTYYLTCTGGDGQGNLFPIYTSTDLLSWTRAGQIFTKGQFPAWGSGNWWAPELHRVGDRIVAVFSSLDTTTKKNAIGLATAPTPFGPFTDRGSPILSDPANSAIDAHLSVESGSPILYFKGERLKDGKGADILLAMPLSADATESAGPAKTILTLSESWEGTIIEAPWVVKRDDDYYLFYSGNLYCNSSYSVGVARSKSPLGPFEKHGLPILKSGKRWVGPGHNAITEGADGETWIVYHAYDSSLEGVPACAANAAVDNDKRHALVDRVQWSGGWPKVISKL